MEAEQRLHDQLLLGADAVLRQVCATARRSGIEPVSADKIISVNPRVKVPRDAMTPFLEMAATEPWAVRPERLGWRGFSGGCKFERGDTLFAKITGCIEHGKGAFVDFVDEPAAGSTEFLVLRAGNRLTPESLFLISRWPAVRSHLIQRMVGSSGRQRVPTDAFSSLELTIPASLDDWTHEASFIEQAFARGLGAWQSQRRLRALRDQLLAKLVSGNLRVADDYLTDAAPVTVGER